MTLDSPAVTKLRDDVWGLDGAKDVSLSDLNKEYHIQNKLCSCPRAMSRFKGPSNTKSTKIQGKRMNSLKAVTGNIQGGI